MALTFPVLVFFSGTLYYLRVIQVDDLVGPLNIGLVMFLEKFF